MKNWIWIAAAAAGVYFLAKRRSAPGTTTITDPATGQQITVGIPRNTVAAAGSAPVAGTGTATLADDIVKPFVFTGSGPAPVGTVGIDPGSISMMNGFM